MENCLLSLSQKLALWGVKDIIAQGMIVFCLLWASIAGLWTLLRRKPETIILVLLLATGLWFII